MALEGEKSRLKKIVADLTLDRKMLQAKAVYKMIRGIVCRLQDPPKALKPGRMRELVRGKCIDWGVSTRSACGDLRFMANNLTVIGRARVCAVRIEDTGGGHGY